MKIEKCFQLGHFCKVLYMGFTEENLFDKLKSVFEKQKSENCFQNIKKIKIRGGRIATPSCVTTPILCWDVCVATFIRLGVATRPSTLFSLTATRGHPLSSVGGGPVAPFLRWGGCTTIPYVLLGVAV